MGPSSRRRLPTGAPRTARWRRTAALLISAGSLVGCSLLVGGLNDQVIVAADGSTSSDAPYVQMDSGPAGDGAPPVACRSTVGWHLDCTFGSAVGYQLASHAAAPALLAQELHSAVLYIAEANEERDGETLVTTVTNSGDADTFTNFLNFDQAPPTFFAAGSFGTTMSGGSIVTTPQLADGGVEGFVELGLSLSPSQDLFGPYDIGPLFDPSHPPVLIGALAGAQITDPQNVFVGANAVLDGGAARPALVRVVLQLVGTSVTPTVTVSPASDDPDAAAGSDASAASDGGDAGDAQTFDGGDDAEAAPVARPLVRMTCGSQVGLAAPLQFWLAGSSADDAGTAELFIDYAPANPPKRVTLPFVPDTAVGAVTYQNLAFVIGQMNGSAALVALSNAAPYIRGTYVIPVGAAPVVGRYAAILNDGMITAANVTADGTLVLAQWSLVQDATTGATAITPVDDFGNGGLLTIPLEEPVDFGRLGSLGSDLYVSVRLQSSGASQLLRIRKN